MAVSPAVMLRLLQGLAGRGGVMRGGPVPRPVPGGYLRAGPVPAPVGGGYRRTPIGQIPSPHVRQSPVMPRSPVGGAIYDMPNPRPSPVMPLPAVGRTDVLPQVPYHPVPLPNPRPGG